ncbi:FNIP repeat-containing protein [Cavenderia fasciculata]|uniref:FNIP repeat-containing protein n=1 Tax=Cavenderia fasciculata TaxID=261658 RepID=F4PX55_CACFS|nr:FNIP repeat-containing protein [Cavenderia fasciculata]EGG19858.1 FNIP repeat-containing protein [Cavenderia fasciculata]|eukprot:XP_004358204.1 FNIP repeat-containing protein [Cavenderia fasciculata]
MADTANDISDTQQTSSDTIEDKINPILLSLTFANDYNQFLTVGVLSSSLQSLVFGDEYNQPLTVGVLPSSLQSLVFGDEYNQRLSVGVLPSSLQSLVFGVGYNQRLSVGVLPSSLQSLRFGSYYNQPLSVGVLPTSLQSLMFGHYYNQPLSVGVLPSSLQSLVFGDDYNQPLSVGELPSSLQSLVFGDEYNQPLSVGVLPSSLQSLVFGWNYYQPLSVGVLPSSLQSLVFGDDYNQPLSVGVLPSSLQSLKFGLEYNQPLSVGVLPTSLQSLEFGWNYYQPLSVGVLPSSLKSLSFSGKYNQPLPIRVLPPSLQSLGFSWRYNQPLSVGELPSSLQSLVFGWNYYQPLSVGELPSSLQSLVFGYKYNQPLSVGVLPSSLQSLMFGHDYNQPLSVGVLPSSLQSLVFGYYYNQHISVGVLPSSLQSLVFGDDYNQPLSVGVLPSSLQSLVFGYKYNQPISVGVLPSSLQSLVFGDDYNQPLSVGVLPSSLQSLVFGDDYNQPLSVGVLPTSLQSLVFGYKYNQPLSVGVLPTSLQSLEFGSSYNQRLSVGVLPTSLQSLLFGHINIEISPTRVLVDFKQTIANRNFIKLGSLGVIKLPNIKILPKITSWYNGQNNILTLTTFNPNPNSINYDPNYLMVYPIKSTDYVTVNNHKYFKLHPFPYSDNQVIFVMSESGVLFVYKEIDYSSNQSIYNKVQFEITTMKLFISDSMFVQYKDHQDDSDLKKIYILTHFCEGGDLEQLFQSMTKWNISQKQQPLPEYKYIPESEIWVYIRRLFLILEKLSQHNLAHLDIKPLNLFIGNDGEIVLGDFGCCHTYVDHNTSVSNAKIDKVTNNNQENNDSNQTTAQYAIKIAKTLASRGTKGYYSPESKQKKYYPSSDIYSVGSTILHLLSCHPDDIGHRIEFVNNHKNNNFDTNHIKISTDRYSEYLINFVKNLLIETPDDRLSLDDLVGEIVNEHTQRITSFLIDRRQILTNTTTLILDGEFNSPLEGLLPPTLLKLKLLGNFNQPITWGDIPDSVETLIFGSSFNSDIVSFPRSLKHLVLGKSFNQSLGSFSMPTIHITTSNWNHTLSNVFVNWSDQALKSINVYHCQDSEQTTINSFIKNKPNFILTIGEQSYGIGDIKRSDNILEWKNNNIKLSINLEDVKVISYVQASIYPHLFCQIGRTEFESINQHFVECQPDSEYPLKKMEKLFELDEDDIHQVFEHNQYLNIRLIYNKTSVD